MTTFTSTLPQDLLLDLQETSDRLKIPKNKLIERALRIYLDQLNKVEYVKSYKKAGEDADIMSMAEEGMEDYFQQISENETR